MHDQHQAGQEQELRWLVKRLGAGDPNGSADELRAKAESAIRALEKQIKNADWILKNIHDSVDFLSCAHRFQACVVCEVLAALAHKR